MQSHTPTAPFGPRSLTLAHVATQIATAARPPEKVVHKWKIFQTICTARERLGVSERALTVLDALLSFHPETALTGEDDLIVFPSNHRLTLRAHGMPASTLRRHLAVLVDAGLIVRRDSPNGKRYARKGDGGDIELAFGFDLSPLVVRSEEFENLAAEIEAEARALKLARERIGISPSAWEEAQTVLGETQAAVGVACILQRGTTIRSAGGYLRGLTRKAEVGEFSLGPILMSQINSRLHEKRRA